MRDGSWTGAILGRLNLVVRVSQMVKLVLSFCTRRRLLLLLMTTQLRPFTQHASHGDERVTNCQTYDMPFSNCPAILSGEAAMLSSQPLEWPIDFPLHIYMSIEVVVLI